MASVGHRYVLVLKEIFLSVLSIALWKSHEQIILAVVDGSLKSLSLEKQLNSDRNDEQNYILVNPSRGWTKVDCCHLNTAPDFTTS